MSEQTIEVIVVAQGDKPTGDAGGFDFLMLTKDGDAIKAGALRCEYKRADDTGFDVRILSEAGEPAPGLTSPVKAETAAEAAESTITEFVEHYAIGRALHERRAERESAVLH